MPHAPNRIYGHVFHLITPNEWFAGFVIIVLLAVILLSALQHLFFSQPTDAPISESLYSSADSSESTVLKSATVEQAAQSASVEWHFPAIEQTDWTTPGQVTRYDAETLYVKIDGRADFFLQNGFRELIFGRYENPAGASVEIYIYTMDKSASARDIFAREKPPISNPLSIADAAYETGGAVFFTRDRHYVQILPGDDKADTKTAALQIARQLAASNLP